MRPWTFFSGAYWKCPCSIRIHLNTVVILIQKILFSSSFFFCVASTILCIFQPFCFNKSVVLTLFGKVFKVFLFDFILAKIELEGRCKNHFILGRNNVDQGLLKCHSVTEIRSQTKQSSFRKKIHRILIQLLTNQPAQNSSECVNWE